MSASSAPGNRKDISAIIVSYNTKALLELCLRTLRDTCQRHSLELVVIDNDSRDGSPEMVAAQFPDAILIRNHDNAGFARACNQGIAVCSGRYVLLVNSDVEMLAGTLDGMIEFMDAHPEAGLSACRLLNGDRSVQDSVRRFPTLTGELLGSLFLDRVLAGSRFFGAYRMQGRMPETTTEVDQPSGAFLLARRAVLDSPGLLDEGFFMYYEEVDWCKRIREAGWKIFYVPGFEAIHYGGQSAGPLGAFPYVESMRSKLRYYRKHSGAGAAWIVRSLGFVEILMRGLAWLLTAPARILGAQTGKRLVGPAVLGRVAGVLWSPTPRR